MVHPEDIHGLDGVSDGEKRVFRFLREAGRPRRDYIVWFTPQIEGLEPDFVLFSRKLGLVVLEVKDWAAHQIGKANPHTVTLRIGGKEEQRPNPDRQAKGYVDALRDVLRRCSALRSDKPEYRGKLAVPIARIVVFPNILREEYVGAGLDRWLPMDRVLLEDDLDAASDLLCDTSGKRFHDRLARAGFPFAFDGLSETSIEQLHAAIWPSIRIDPPKREGVRKDRFGQEVRSLDASQARLVRRLGRGHQILKGPPGCGKTLVLVHPCCHLRKYEQGAKRILLVFFNIPLASYLKRLLQEKGIGTGPDGIQVCHFFELCSQILGEPVAYDDKDPDYYDLITEETGNRVLAVGHAVGLFDAILVDEGQDFDDEKIRILLGMVRPGGDFVLALDAYQDLYRKGGSPLKAQGIKAKGRTHYLKTGYRNTREIMEFTQRFIGQDQQRTIRQARLPFEDALRGNPPEIPRFASYEEIEEFLTTDLQDVVQRDEYKRSEIAVLYDDKAYDSDGFTYDNRNLPLRLRKTLDAAGIPTKWVSEDVRSKQLFDITTDSVSLISIHSAKGLDFDLVYLIGADRIHPTDETRERLIRLLYVAMTRVKHRLVIPYVEASEFARKMKACPTQH